MKKLYLLGAVCAAIFSVVTLSSHAEPVSGQGNLGETLQPRDLDGNQDTAEAWYDTVLDITWLADTNLAASNTFGVSNIHYTGLMDWDTANSWITAMNADGVTGYLGTSGWRLPTMVDTGTPGCDPDWVGTDCGYNVQTTSGSPPYPAVTVYSEMASMFYDTLGNKGFFDTSGNSNQPGYGLTNTGRFDNLQDDAYWSGVEYAPDTLNAWRFDFDLGGQNAGNKGNDNFVWAVHPGVIGTAMPVDLSGTIKTADGADICAMVLASGQFMFSCNPPGVFSLTDLPRENDGTVKRQIYADGFFPKIDVLTSSTDESVVMTRSGTCPSYNTPYDPGFFPNSAGVWINISGKVLLQNSQTPICAMVLANGQFMFSCDGTGSYALNIPLDTNGQFKLQVYADGFAPTIQTFDEFSAANDVRMARATECQ